MAQVTKFTIDPNLSGIQLRTQASEMLTALSTLNSGYLEPVNPSAGMLWLDTTKNILKIRDKTNTAWLDFASVNDKVLAVNAASATDSLKLGGLAADKYAKKDDIPAAPQAATETKAGIVKLKNSIAGSLSDTAVSEKAIMDFITSNFANSKQESGYTKLPNGLIFQWGTVGDREGGDIREIYPIAFPSRCLMLVLGNLIDAGGDTSIGIGHYRMLAFDQDKTGFTARGPRSFNSGYLAIGY